MGFCQNILVATFYVTLHNHPIDPSAGHQFTSSCIGKRIFPGGFFIPHNVGRARLINKDFVPLRLDVLSSIPALFWGIGALAWVPLSMAIGRRPVFLLCALLLTLSTLMAALSHNFYTHLAARCLQGIAGSISPSTVSSYKVCTAPTPL